MHSEADAEAEERYIKIEWRETGKHEVTVRGFTRRSDCERLLKAAQRHLFSCQMRGIPISSETQVPRKGEIDDMPLEGAGGR